MSPHDTRSRAEEVEAAFVEGLRRGRSGMWNDMSDHAAWLDSKAYMRLGYIISRCLKCGSRIADPNLMERCAGCGHGHPICANCRNECMAITSQKSERAPHSFEKHRLDQIIKAPLERIADGEAPCPPPKVRK